MDSNQSKIAGFVNNLTEEQFAWLKSCVIERDPNLELTDKFDQAIAQLTVSDLSKAMKDNPALVLRLEERLSKKRESEDGRQFTVNIKDYKVKDTGFERVLEECDKEALERYKGVIARRERYEAAAAVRRQREADRGQDGDYGPTGREIREAVNACR